MSPENVVRRPVLRYHGGKWRLAPWIISHFPAHRVYVEPFGGAASVLLRKLRSYAEVYNDLDDGLVNLFQVLRDPEQARHFRDVTTLTPFARAEFELSYVPCVDPVEWARRLAFRAFAGFGSAAANPDHSTGFRSNVTRSGSTPAVDWANWPEQIERFTERLRGVVIESMDALTLLAKYDSAETLFYVDPPYPHSTRSFKSRRTGQVYRHEMTDTQHRDLATTLHGLRGMVVLSGYASPLYTDLYPDWRSVTKDTHGDGAVDRTEVLWLNPACSAALECPAVSCPPGDDQ